MMTLNDIQKLIRPSILNLKAYSSARHNFNKEASVFLDANENPFDNGINRYPDPFQRDLKKRISLLKQQPVENIFIGNGSDEALDVIVRSFCEPKEDNIIICPPTYGMYKVTADIHNVSVLEVPLNENFEVDVTQILETANEHSKLLILCSPNNPTGNSIDFNTLRQIAENFKGIIIIDEAYIDFSTNASALKCLTEFPQIIVMQTLSKAWGMAGLRIGMAFAAPEIISVLNKVKPPYNINVLSQKYAIKQLKNTDLLKKNIEQIKLQREKLYDFLKTCEWVENVFKSDANFIIARFKNAQYIYTKLIQKGIVVRNQTHQTLCDNCLRISIGTPKENEILMKTLKTQLK